MTAATATLQIQIDPANPSRIAFSQPVSLDDAFQFLWGGKPSQPGVLKPDPAERPLQGKQRSYLVDLRDMQVLYSLRNGLTNEFMRRRVIGTNRPVELPAWIPEQIRKDALAGNFKNGVTRLAGPPPFGSIIVWSNNSGGFLDIQIYQEFPSDEAFYLRLTGGDLRRARLLHGVYTQFNRDIWSLLNKGYSPAFARDELRRINDEIYRAVLEGCAMILTMGVGITSLNNMMAKNAEQVERAATRLIESRGMRREVVVNIGGTGEVPGAINLNPNEIASRKDIPNWVKGLGEEIGELFKPGSVDKIISKDLPPNVIDWRRTIPGAHSALREGGTITIAFKFIDNDAKIIIKEMERVGFRNIEDLGGFGGVIKAVK